MATILKAAGNGSWQVLKMTGNHVKWGAYKGLSCVAFALAVNAWALGNVFAFSTAFPPFATMRDSVLPEYMQGNKLLSSISISMTLFGGALGCAWVSDKVSDRADREWARLHPSPNAAIQN